MTPPPILQTDAPQLIQILKDPAATVFQKAKACHRLAVIVDRDAVPALAALLAHPELSHCARFDLDPNSDPSAAAAPARMSGPPAAKVFPQALFSARDSLKPIVARFALICADGLMPSKGALATGLYKLLTGPAQPKVIRLSAIGTLSRPDSLRPFKTAASVPA